jgi:hypothetical protein
VATELTGKVLVDCFAARQNRPGSARENGSRLRIRTSRSALEAGARWRGALGSACGRGGAGPRNAGSRARGGPRVRGCPSIPASLPAARCAGRGQGSRSDGRARGRLALMPPRTPGTHGLPQVPRRRRPWTALGTLSPAARAARDRRFGRCDSDGGGD